MCGCSGEPFKAANRRCWAEKRGSVQHVLFRTFSRSREGANLSTATFGRRPQQPRAGVARVTSPLSSAAQLCLSCGERATPCRARRLQLTALVEVSAPVTAGGPECVSRAVTSACAHCIGAGRRGQVRQLQATVSDSRPGSSVPAVEPKRRLRFFSKRGSPSSCGPYTGRPAPEKRSSCLRISVLLESSTGYARPA